MRSLRSPRHVPSILLYTSALLLLTMSAGARAQEADQAPPAYIAALDGAATLERDGQAQPAAINEPLVPGDRLRTATGRLEVSFPDGTVLDVDEYSVVDLQAPTALRLMQGRARLVVAGAGRPAEAPRYQIDTPAASVRTNGPGEYRLAVVADASSTATELATVRGSAALLTESGTMPVEAGEVSVARAGEAPAIPRSFNSARYDAFDRWSAAQQDARLSSAAADEYLPADLQMYGGTLDQNGSWAYAAPYGDVWYPRVADTWRPYYNGRWSAARPYGWTWVGFDRWSWPTDHYGRWGFQRDRWFWIPGRTWGPAWVAWAAAPGYVSWCPLGVDSQPLFALSPGAASFSRGWVIVPRTVFGDTDYRIDRYAVSAQRFRHAVCPAVDAAGRGAARGRPPLRRDSRRIGRHARARTRAQRGGAGRRRAQCRGAEISADGPRRARADVRPDVGAACHLRATADPVQSAAVGAAPGAGSRRATMGRTVGAGRAALGAPGVASAGDRRA